MAKQNTEEEIRPATTGSFFRIKKEVNDDFTHKCKKSTRFAKTSSQSQRDMIMEELMNKYIEHGDMLFNIIEFDKHTSENNPFK